MRVITFGTFDVFHIGHLRILERARAFGDTLVVGVSTDALNHAKKGRYPVYTQDERCEIIRALRCVDEVFLEESLDLKRHYLRQYRADVLVMGDDGRAAILATRREPLTLWPRGAGSASRRKNSSVKITLFRIAHSAQP